LILYSLTSHFHFDRTDFFSVFIQDIAERALIIVDNHLPRVRVSFKFGDAAVICDSRFPAAMLPMITNKATAMIIASGDPEATVSINGVRVLGIHLPSATLMPVIPLGINFISPDMDPQIEPIIRRDRVSFHVGYYQWDIDVRLLFGDVRVIVYSRFDSHLVPAAYEIAKRIALATRDSHYHLQQC
jgi:hypothetical protein